MASKKSAVPKQRFKGGSPNDDVGIQVPAGRILVDRTRWQTVLLAPDKPLIYRLFNAAPSEGTGNSMIVEVNGAKGHLRIDPGSSLDVAARRIRVKAGSGSEDHSVVGWYVLVS